MNRIVLVDGCNFIDFPTGGQLTFAKQLINTFPENFILVGITTNPNTPIGCWTKLTIDDLSFDFLPILYRKNCNEKPFIPARITWVIALLRYLRKIRDAKPSYYFTQDISSLYPVNKIKRSKVIHCSAGLNNPFYNTRYKWAKVFYKIFERFWFKELSKTYLLMAAADNYTISNLKSRSNKLIDKEIISFPTRYDDKTFFPKDKMITRDKLNIPKDKTVIVTSGRISNVKGWELVLDVINIAKKRNLNFHLYWLGDGEDKIRMENSISEYNLTNITIMGNVSHELLSDYLAASDLFILASYREGWSTSIVEALSCGKNVVTTNVSSAGDMIFEGKNGFIVYERDAELFCSKILDALKLPDPNHISCDVVEPMKLSNLKAELLKIWDL